MHLPHFAFKCHVIQKYHNTKGYKQKMYILSEHKKYKTQVNIQNSTQNTMNQATRQLNHTNAAVCHCDVARYKVIYQRHTTHTPVLRPFFRDYPGEPVPER